MIDDWTCSICHEALPEYPLYCVANLEPGCVQIRAIIYDDCGAALRKPVESAELDGR